MVSSVSVVNDVWYLNKGKKKNILLTHYISQFSYIKVSWFDQALNSTCQITGNSVQHEPRVSVSLAILSSPKLS